MVSEILVKPDQLARELENPGWVVVDCRFDLADTGRGGRDYAEGHIPGAHYAHLDRDLSGPLTPKTGRHPLPDASSFMSWLGELGIRRESTVVAYDDAGGSMAVRLWWMLRWMGHERAALLDGGWQAWRQAGLPTTDAAPAPALSRALYEGLEQTNLIVATQDLADEGMRKRLVDVRTAERFRGEAEPIDPVAGHIPGADNLPWPEHLDDQGFFLSQGALADKYRLATGGDPSGRILMCGSGVTACLGIFALALTGVEDARLYAGSWSEWIRDPSRPVATGVD